MTRLSRTYLKSLTLAGALAAAVTSAAHAQDDVEMLGLMHGGARPPAAFYALKARNPNAFEFSRDNGWIRRARAVAARRRVARTGMTPRAGAALLQGAGMVLQGDLNVPVFLVMYANTDSVATVTVLSRDTMEFRFYGTHAAPPYSVHTYYKEMSDDRLSVNGTVFPWTRVSMDDKDYEGGTNGLPPGGNTAGLIREAVAAHDDTVDYGQFDNDGPDGIPNSGDDDGFIDAVVVIHPEVDGSCKNVNAEATDNIWAHKSTVSGFTNDSAVGGGFIQIRDYIIQGGQGGDSGCASDEPQAMGVVAHETGHIFGLPDLYDTGGGTAGIGYWGIMGTGNFQVPSRPVSMEAWSRAELGWVTEVLLPGDTTIEVSPVELSDTAYIIPISGSTEYFLLENRQPIGADSAIVIPRPLGGNGILAPGLLIWHVDSALIAARSLPFNRVNASLPHALALEQADGLGQLQKTSGGNRGDESDPFPGLFNRSKFGFATNPTTARNDGSPTYIDIDSISQVAPFGPMRFRLRFAQPTVIAATDTLAVFRLDSVQFNRFLDVLMDGTLHQLEMDSVQVVNGGRNRYTWLSWSNGGARSHTFTGSAAGDTITGEVSAEFLLQVATDGAGGGSVTVAPVLDLASGVFVTEDSAVKLMATVTMGGYVFEGWSGDTVASGDTLDLVMTRPFSITATFSTPLVFSTTQLAPGVVGATYVQSLSVSGGTGSYSWLVASGALPKGLALAQTGTLVGRPEQVGIFDFEVNVSSGAQDATTAFQMDVSAPVLVVDDVIGHLVGPAAPLSGDELSYLDLIGNRNGRYDVGDFLAWLDAGGVAITQAELSKLIRQLKEGAPR